MKTYLLSLLLLISLGLQAHNTAPETVWLDVRSAEEFAAGHLAGAVNIPHMEVSARIAELKLDKDTPIAIYCKSGRRAGIALSALEELGYTALSNKGGFEDLQQQLNSDNERQ